MPTCRALLLPLLLALGGCNALVSEGSADLAGLSGAAIAGAVTKDGATAAGIGLVVQSAARAGLEYAQRRLQRAEQNIIARAAGDLEPGKVANWSVAHDLRLQDDHQGQVTVSREIGGLGLECREIVFSVEGPAREGADPASLTRGFYVAIICRNGAEWKWASAEPATERWGALQ